MTPDKLLYEKNRVMDLWPNSRGPPKLRFILNIVSEHILRFVNESILNRVPRHLFHYFNVRNHEIHHYKTKNNDDLILEKVNL